MIVPAVCFTFETAPFQGETSNAINICMSQLIFPEETDGGDRVRFTSRTRSSESSDANISRGISLLRSSKFPAASARGWVWGGSECGKESE